MGTPKAAWMNWKMKSTELSRWFLPVAICFLELLFHIWVGGSISLASVLNLMGFSLAFVFPITGKTIKKQSITGAKCSPPITLLRQYGFYRSSK